MTGFYTGFHISCFVLFRNETENESNSDYEGAYVDGIYKRCCSSSGTYSHLRLCLYQEVHQNCSSESGRPWSQLEGQEDLKWTALKSKGQVAKTGLIFRVKVDGTQDYLRDQLNTLRTLTFYLLNR